MNVRRWLPALSGMACLGCGVGLISIFGFFVEPLSQAFGVGAATINIAPVALLLVPAFLAPVVGRLVDRVSIRRLTLAGVTCSMLSLCLASQAPALWVAALGFLGFAVGLTLYGPVVINGLMVKVYPGREARALAVAAMGISVATMLLPPLVGRLLAGMDWRTALASLALGLMVILWLLVLVGIPARSGGPVGPAKVGAAANFYGRPAFWLIGICVAMALNVSLVLGICYPPHFTSQGYSVAQAGWFIAAGGLAGLAGKGFVAWLADAGRHHARWIAAALLLVQMGGILLLLGAADANDILIAVGLAGFGAGAFIPMHPYLNSRYFDVTNIGHVNGAQMPLFLPFGLVGAPLAGYAYDQFGNYQLVLQCLAGVVAIAVALVLALPPSRRVPGDN